MATLVQKEYQQWIYSPAACGIRLNGTIVCSGPAVYNWGGDVPDYAAQFHGLYSAVEIVFGNVIAIRQSDNRLEIHGPSLGTSWFTVGNNYPSVPFSQIVTSGQIACGVANGRKQGQEFGPWIECWYEA
jgi:hypothetical protein